MTFSWGFFEAHKMAAAAANVRAMSSSILSLCSLCLVFTGAPNENIVQNHLNIALLNVF